MKKYRITCTEEQLRLIADAVEDWTRFLSGQTEMWRALDQLPLVESLLAREELRKVQKYVTPKLPQNASYGWSGAGCENERQRKSIAMGYGIYRQILHFLTLKNNLDNVYTSPTLTCEEQGGLIEIKEE